MQANGDGWGPWKTGDYGLVERESEDGAWELMSEDYANRLEAQARRAERLEAALRLFMTLADDAWEDWLFESNGHEYEPEEWSVARAALSEKGD